MPADLWPEWPPASFAANEPADADPWRVATWWLIADSPRLLFGWAYSWPSDAGRAEWTRPHKIDEFGSSANRLQICRLVLSGPWATVRVVLDQIAHGDSLEASSSRAGIAPPRPPLDAASLGNVVGSQPSPTGSKSANFVVAPWRLLPSRDSRTGGLASPAVDVSAIRAALVRVNKAEALPPDDDAADRVLRILGEDSGLDFGGSGRGIDLPRLGDLEVLVMPSAKGEDSLVETTASDEEIEIQIDTRHIRDPRRALARCRQIHRDVVLKDDLIAIEPCDGAKWVGSVELSPVGPSSAEIEVWVSRSASEAGFQLWYSHRVDWLRQIGLNLQLVGPEVVLDAEWLTRWSEQRRLTTGQRKRVDAMRTIRRVADNMPSLIGRPTELWRAAEEGARRLREKFVPTESGAKFIDQRSNPESDSDLAVAEWFRSTFGTSSGGDSPGPLLLIDPYFDERGIDLIARTEVSGRRFMVVTTLKDAESTAPAGRQSRLKDAIVRNALALEGLSLDLLVVPPNQLHDRLALEFDRDGEVAAGFQLSNSLQAATKNHPLLITPIPADVLPQVADAAARMIADAEDLQLLPETASASEPTPSSTASSQRATPAELDTLARDVDSAVSGNDPAQFASSWLSFADALSRTPAPHDELAVRWASADGFIAALGRYLGHASPVATPKGSSALESLASAKLASLDLAAIRRFGFALSRRHRMLGPDWALRFGFETLALTAPREFATTLDAIAGQIEESAPTSERLIAGYKVCLALDALDETICWNAYGQDRLAPLVEAMLKARNDFVRALGGALLGRAVLTHAGEPPARTTLGLEEARKILRFLPRETERVLVIAEAIGEVRPEILSTSQSREAAEVRENELTNWLNDEFPASPNSLRDLLVELARRYDAGRIGARAHDVTGKVLVPLAQAGKIPVVAIANLWMPILERRVESCIRGVRDFDALTDISLTETCAWVLSVNFEQAQSEAGRAHSSSDSVPHTPTADRLDQVFRKAQREVERPFVKSLNSSRWACAQDVLSWLEALGWCVEKYGPASPQIEEYARRWRTRNPRIENSEARNSELQKWVTTMRTANDEA